MQFMNKKGLEPIVIVIIALIIVVAIGGYLIVQKQQPGVSKETAENTMKKEGTVENTPAPSDTSTPSTKIVQITSYGFDPETVTIKAGDTVTFVNKDSIVHWPASAVHSTHGRYPEKGGCIGSKFDACKGLAAGASYSFTFNIKGTWIYHDHLSPLLTGTVVVQ